MTQTDRVPRSRGQIVCKYGLLVATVASLCQIILWTFKYQDFLMPAYMPPHLSTVQPTGSVNEHDTNVNSSIRNKGARNKIILISNTFYQKAIWAGNSGRIGFQNSFCHYQNCIATDDRVRYGRSADVVAFHCSDRYKKWPEYRHPRQIYVAACMESPPHTSEWSFKQFNGIINATATYRLDSDIPTPYYLVVAKGTHAQPLPLEQVSYQNKTKGVAWMVSHCNAISRRDDYVRELRKHIDVDIYGKCGSKSCPFGRQCRELQATYKFYLAFENSFCKDYITEKVYSQLMNGVVPVVLGGANYSQHIPPHSYVNARDFSPRELAEFLKRVGDNEEEYMKYFQWRSSYDIIASSRYKFFCDMCKLANEGTFHKLPWDVHEWWNKDTCDNTVVKKLLKQRR